MTEYIATTDQVTSAYLKVHGRSEEVRDELSRWFEEFSRQEREAGWDESHGTPCDMYTRDDFCYEYHRNPHRKETP